MMKLELDSKYKVIFTCKDSGYRFSSELYFRNIFIGDSGELIYNFSESLLDDSVFHNFSSDDYEIHIFKIDKGDDL